MRIIEIMYNKTLLPTKGKNSVKKKKIRSEYCHYC